MLSVIIGKLSLPCWSSQTSHNQGKGMDDTKDKPIDEKVPVPESSLLSWQKTHQHFISVFFFFFFKTVEQRQIFFTHLKVRLF